LYRKCQIGVRTDYLLEPWNIDVQTSGAVQWGRLANGFGLPHSCQAASLSDENGARLL